MSGFKGRALLKGVAAAVGFLLLAVLVLTVLLMFTGFSEERLPEIGAVLRFAAVFIGAVLTARSAGCLGLVHGLAVAVVFCGLTVLLLAVQSSACLSLAALLPRFGLLALAGLLGGLVGIGLAAEQ